MFLFATIALTTLAVLSPAVGQISEAPSLAPSASPAPSYEADLPQFSWDLFSLPELSTFSFSESSDTSEITLYYNISRRDTLIQAFQDDCLTAVDDSIVSLTSSTFPVSPTHADFSVGVNIHQDNITDSLLWTDVGVGEGLISMCVRVDLLLPSSSTSVTFHEQTLDVSIGLTQGFEITSIDLDRLNATENDGEADFNYEVTACHCDGPTTRNCINDTLTQGSDVYLCVETTAVNVEIASVRELQMVQDQGGLNEFSTTPIVGGVADPLTQVTIVNKEATIRYQMVSEFFDSPNPADVDALGSVLLTFVDDDGATRQLGTAKVSKVSTPSRRELQGEEDSVDIAVKFALESAVDNDSSSAAVVGVSSLIILMVASGVVAL